MTAIRKEIIVLVQSTDNGRPAWWYVKCFNRITAEKLKGICRLGKSEIIPLEEYGEVILSGWGDAPPDDIIQQIESQYT